MVLKKPYAFLIKHFKIIHLILSALLLYLIFCTNNIFNFFSSYVSSGYVTHEVNIASIYINILIYLVIFLVLILTAFIYFLMRQKEKGTKLYFSILFFYIVLFILVSVSYNIMMSIDDGSVTTQVARSARDISLMVYIVQGFFFVYALLRGIGFDIKHFNFESDIEDLEITDIDSEEFEVNFGKNGYKYQRDFRRFLRESRYYFLENKFALFVLLAIVVVIVGTVMYMNFGVYHRIYGQRQRMNHNGLKIQVLDSELSNMDLGGREFSNGKYYMAVSIDVVNNASTDTSLDYENFKLMVGNDYLMPILDRGFYFADMGIPYTRNFAIGAHSEGVYVLVYELDKDMINKRLMLRILESLQNTLIGVTPIYKDVRLTYKTLDAKTDVKSYELGKILELSDTRLGLTHLQIKDYSFTSSYVYDYQKCTGTICQNLKGMISVDPIKYGGNKKVLALTVDFGIDDSSYYYQSRRGMNSFISDFVRVRYQNSEGTKEIEVNNLTPSNLDNVWLLAVTNEAEWANHVDILVEIRGQIYVMNLK